MKKIMMFVVSFLLLQATVAFAQPRGPEMHEPPAGFAMPMPPMPCMGPSPLDMLDLVDLTSSQKAAVVTLLKKQIELMDKNVGAESPDLRMESRKAMRTAMEKGDVEAVRTLASHKGEEVTRRLVEQATFVAELRGILTPDQLKRLDALQDRLAARFERRMQDTEDGPEGIGGMRAERPAHRPGGPEHMRPPRMFPEEMKRDMQRWIDENS
ncbi:MAG: Spy/CpxP family protein refolding chaperone [Halodesulfovibrio sp.]